MNTVSISAMIVIALLAPAAHADPLDGPRYPGESRHERAPPPTYLPSWERTQRHYLPSYQIRTGAPQNMWRLLRRHLAPTAV